MFEILGKIQGYVGQGVVVQVKSYHHDFLFVLWLQINENFRCRYCMTTEPYTLSS